MAPNTPAFTPARHLHGSLATAPPTAPPLAPPFTGPSPQLALPLAPYILPAPSP